MSNRYSIHTNYGSTIPFAGASDDTTVTDNETGRTGHVYTSRGGVGDSGKSTEEKVGEAIADGKVHWDED